MNKKILSYLNGEGFTYLWRKFGEHDYRPMKGNLEQLLARNSTTPFWERFIVNRRCAIIGGHRKYTGRLDRTGKAEIRSLLST